MTEHAQANKPGGLPNPEKSQFLEPVNLAG